MAGSKSSSSSSSSVQRKTSSNDMLALATACLDGNFAEAQRLIEAGHDINYRDRNNWTPLHCSSSAGNIDIVDYLLKQESIIVNGIFAVNNDGNTALHYLVRDRVVS
jgi:ankyrin repeat protein